MADMTIKECENLSTDIALDVKEAVHVLEVMMECAREVPEKFIGLYSMPSVLIKALKGTVAKSEDLDSALFEIWQEQQKGEKKDD